MSWTDERVEQLRATLARRQEREPDRQPAGHGTHPQRRHRQGSPARPRRPRQVAGPSAPGRGRASSQPSAHRAAAPALTPSPRRSCAARRRSRSRRRRRPRRAGGFESVVLPMSLRVTIIELKEAMCRWPLGDPTSPDFRYCGSPGGRPALIARIMGASPISRRRTAAAPRTRCARPDGSCSLSAVCPPCAPAAAPRTHACHSAESLVESVAGPAHGADRVAFASSRQRLAQPADMNVDGALVDLGRLAPDAVEQLRRAKTPGPAFPADIRAAGIRSGRDGCRVRRGARGGFRDRGRGRRRRGVSAMRSGRLRRSSARTRAISSGTENGLTT